MYEVSKSLQLKAAVLGGAMAPAIAFAVEPYDAAVTAIIAAVALVVVAAWSIWTAVRVPGFVMKIVNKFANKAT